MIRHANHRYHLMAAEWQRGKIVLAGPICNLRSVISNLQSKGGA